MKTTVNDSVVRQFVPRSGFPTTRTTVAAGSPDVLTLDGGRATDAPVSMATVRALKAAKAASGAHDVKVVKRMDSKEGGWIELLRDPDPHFTPREYTREQQQKNAEIVKAFGTATPPTSDVLLHYAGDPPKGVKVDPIPVILVHGATKDGHFFWDPKEDGSGNGPAQKLRAEGKQVFAVTFADNQGDNDLQAQQLINAKDRVKELTEAKQVDLVGHSKGAVPVGIVPSDFRQSWMTPHQHDVRRVGLIAGPNGGIDYSHRHPVANPVLALNAINAPMTWKKWGIGFFAVDYKHKGFSKAGSFPGQGQLLNKWDHAFALPAFEQDWYTTYHGGQGFVSQSEGIDAHIQESGNYMPRLMSTPMDSKVEVGLLAGNRANIPMILNEYTGPSDGLVFVRSALTTRPGENVVKADVLPLHHKALISEPAGQKWLSDFLRADHHTPMSQDQIDAVVERGERTAC